MIRCNLKTVRNHVAKREEFKCNESLRGEWNFFLNIGEASRGIGMEMQNHILGNDNNFIIYSYDTPIAIWNDNKGWWKNDEHYSVTTSRHMSAISMGIN